MSRLTDTLALLYQYQDADIQKLTARITERRKATWINTLTELTQRHGCKQLPGTPKGADAKELARMSKEDAESIARTFNRDVRRQIERIFKENPRANRNVYYKQLEAWAKARDSWKTQQIGLNVDSTARQFAQNRFYDENSIADSKYIFTGPPPTCKRCVKLFAAGAVDKSFVRNHQAPVHLGCPHLWRNLSIRKMPCDTLWIG